MKFIVILILAAQSAFAQLTPAQTEQFAQAIYRVEGGSRTKYPFGVKSIDTGGDYAKAKRITEVSIRNNYARWIKAGKPVSFIKFMALRWCTPSADPTGHTNWVLNMSKLINFSVD